MLALSEGRATGPDVEMTEDREGDESLTGDEMIVRVIEMSIRPEPESEEKKWTFRAMVIILELSMCKLPICVSSILTLQLSIAVYIPAYQFPRHSHGFGMLIEDEILIGAEYSVVFGASAP